MPVSPWVEIYSNYDKAFVDFVHDTLSFEDRPLLCVFASPERALAQVKKVVRERSGTEPKVTPLPFGSIERVSEVPDPERFVNYTCRRDYYNPRADVYESTDRPTPVKISMQLQVWARMLRDLDSLQMQVIQALRFNEKFLTVKHAYPVNELLCRMILARVDNASSYDTNEGQRILRRVFAFELDAWVCKPYTSIGRVKSVEVELRDTTIDGDLMDTVTETEDVV